MLAQLQEGEFWVEEEEFLREFDEVTVGYPVTEAGHLQSLYTGRTFTGWHTSDWVQLFLPDGLRTWRRGTGGVLRGWAAYHLCACLGCGCSLASKVLSQLTRVFSH